MVPPVLEGLDFAPDIREVSESNQTLGEIYE
jgi:hypothetical protein